MISRKYYRYFTGGIGVLATDTLYGLVGKADSQKTVERIYEVRRRSPEKPLIILISDISDLSLFGISPESDEAKMAMRYWPGAVSVILPCDHLEFEYLHRGTKALAFRMPDNQKLLTVLKETGPLVAPSANHEGKPPSLTIEEARGYFGDEVDFYEDAGRVESPASTLIQISGGEVVVLREGVVQIS